MNTTLRFEPARWLVCSPGVYRSLRDYWLPQFRTHSLFATRIRHGWIEDVQPTGLATRLQALESEGVSSLFILLDGMDDVAARALLDLPENVAAIDPVVVDWLESRMGALMQLNAPDPHLRSLLDDSAPSSSQQPHADSGRTPDWWSDLQRALVDWETQAREREPEDFAHYFPHYAQRPIDWRGLAGFGAALDGVPTVFHAAGAGKAANDFVYVEYSLDKQLFGNSPDDVSVVQERSVHDDQAVKLTIQRSPITGQQAVYLTFQADTDAGSPSSFEGSRIELVIDDVTYDLGMVQDDGIAECRVEGTVNIFGVNALLRIGRRQDIDTD